MAALPEKFPLTKANRLLSAGREGLRSQQYLQAIEALEQFQLGAETQHPDYAQAQMWLATAYQKEGQHGKAQALGQQLSTASSPTIQAWAQKFLQTLETAASTAAQNRDISTTAETLASEKHTETEFRTFCRQNLLDDLKEYEGRRHSALKALAFGGAAVSALFAVLVTQTPKVLKWTPVHVPYISNRMCRSAFDTSGVLERLSAEGWPRRYEAAYMQFQTACQDALSQGDSRTSSHYSFEIPPKICRDASVASQLPAASTVENLAVTPEEYQRAYLTLQTACEDRQFSESNFRWTLFIIALFLAGLLFCFWSWAIFYSVQTEMYEYRFKQRIIEKVVDFLNTDRKLDYTAISSDSHNHDTRVALLKSRLFPALGQMPYLQQNDCVSGKVGAIEIFCSEVTADQEISHRFVAAWMSTLVYWNSSALRLQGGGFLVALLSAVQLPLLVLFLLFSLIKSAPYIMGRMMRGQRFNYDSFKEQASNQVTRRQIFKGLFFRSEFNKRFQGQTIIYPDSTAANLKRFSKTTGSLIRLEDPEFNQLFTVYSDDQVEARYILSTSLMERLVKFRQKAKRPISIAFNDNQIFIAIHHERDLFEARLFETMLSFKPMQDYFENFQLMLGIVEDLNLNRQIWTR